MIKLTFLGGAGAIGASSTLLQVDDTSIVVDCGVRFTKLNPLPDLDTLSNSHVDAILVTHAHSDHTGGLPVLSEAYPNAPVYMTPPTMDLVSVLQKDALKIMNLDEREHDVPLYSEKQVTKLLESIRPTHMYDKIEIGPIIATFYPASHIIGASMIHIDTPYGHLLFSGDYSVTAQKTVPGLDIPKIPVDLFITESTYGDRLHSDRKTAEAKLVSTVQATVENGGKILIPAFAIGRAQEVITILKQAIANKRLQPVNIFVDGMVRSVCNVYGDHPRYVTPYIEKQSRRGHAFYNKFIRPVMAKDRRLVCAGDPCVIISSSGMLSGGPSAYYAEKLAGDEKNNIVITGYQDEESPGRALLNLLTDKSAERAIKVNGKLLPIMCQVSSYSLSAHADKMQMVGLIDKLSPKTVVLVHGDKRSKQAFADSLQGLDLVSATEGMTIERKYPRRGLKTRPKINRTALISLSEGGKGSYTLNEIILSAVDGDVEPKHREQLKKDILATGLFCFGDSAERFDSVSQIEETSSQVTELDKEIIKENPKGRLLELCMKAKIQPPLCNRVDKGKNHHLTVAVSIDGEEITSETCVSTKLMISTQRAYKDLLTKVHSKLIGKIEMQTVSPMNSFRSPLAELHELCQRSKTKMPVVKMLPAVSGRFCLEVSLMVGQQKIGSYVAHGASKKEAKLEAYSHLLAEYGEELRKKIVTGSTPLVKDHKSELFMLCAQKRISPPQFFVKTAGEGFEVSGLLNLGDEEIVTKAFSCSTHKQGHQLVAENILTQIHN
ncbi:MAG: MBL fold metallo-hydrolase [Oligoflexales bacterium]|nr:MBL fold metallo-hydrolase [Oligoflexales bacterium]